MQVAQTRLEKRSHRTENENCNDAPNIKIVEEVGTIHANIEHLNNKLAEAQEAKQVAGMGGGLTTLQDLLAIQHKLELDIGVKKNGLRIDKQKCLSIRYLQPPHPSRSTFPYHMRCDIASKNPVFYYTYYNIV